MTAPDCAGCNAIEMHAIKHGDRYLCPQCPELPEAKRRTPTPADAVRAGLGALIGLPERKRHA